MGLYGKLWAEFNQNNFPNPTLLGSFGPLWAGRNNNKYKVS